MKKQIKSSNNLGFQINKWYQDIFNSYEKEPPSVCPECFGVVQKVKGGISRRTGKKYSTFYPCSNCDFTFNKVDLEDIKRSVREECLINNL